MPYPSATLPANADSTSLTSAAPAETPVSGLREMLYAALIALGGHAYLVRQATENPRAFLALLSKVLAAELSPPRATRSGKTAPTAQTARPAAAQSEGVDSRAFLSLIGKALSAELNPSRGSRHGRAGATAPTAPPHASTSVMPDEVSLAHGLSTTDDVSGPADRLAASPASACPSAAAISPVPQSARGCRDTGALPPVRACEIMSAQSAKRLWQYAAKWRPAPGERWRHTFGSADAHRAATCHPVFKSPAYNRVSPQLSNSTTRTSALTPRVA